MLFLKVCIINDLYLASGKDIESAQKGILVIDEFDKLAEKFVATYIKIDAEGAEIDILTGGKKIISEFKPKMKIAAYHKNSDIFEIPILLNKLNENYKIYMCHHPYIPAWDTDFYVKWVYKMED